MKEQIPFPRLFYYIWIPIMLLAFIFTKLYVRKRIANYKDELKMLKSKEMNGIILNIGDPSRGYSNFTIHDEISNSRIFYRLAITWFYEENNIQVKDSISKPANSKVITFYKLKNGVYEQCCEYQIEVERFVRKRE